MGQRAGIVVGVLLALTAAGCGGGGGAVPVPPGAPPLGVMAWDDPDLVVLEWGSGPTFDAEFIVVQGSPDGIAWEDLGDPIPTQYIAVAISFDPTVTEGLSVFFRAFALKGALRSEASPVVHVVRPVRAASPPTVEMTAGGASVTWSRAATNAVPVLERRVERPCGAGSDWVAVPVPAGARAVLDADVAAWTDGAALRYRLTYTANGEASPAVEGVGPLAPLLPPVDLIVELTADGPVLRWTPTSVGADQILVGAQTTISGRRQVATLPANATSILDAGAAGVITYSVQAVCSAAPGLQSPVGSTQENVPAPALLATFDVTSVVTPATSAIGRSSSGTWALVQPGGLTVGTPEAPAPGWRTVPAADGAQPAFAAGDVVHLVGWATYGSSELVHQWGDASTPLHVQSLTTLPFIATFVDALFDGAGAFRVMAAADAASTSLGTDRLAFRYLEGDAAGWISEDVPTCATYRFVGPVQSTLAVDPAGAPGVVLAGAGELFLVRRGAGGWSCEAMPGGPSIHRMVLVLPGTDDALCIHVDSTGDLVAEVRSASGWGTPERIAAATELPGGSLSGGRVAVSPDAMRIAILSRGQLLLRDGGVWSVTTLPLGVGDLGFDPAGRLWVALAGVESVPGSLTGDTYGLLLRER